MNNKGIPKKEKLIKFYSLGYSMKEIGNYLGYSTGKIHKYFHIYNIVPRKWGSDNEFAKKKISKSQKGNIHALGFKMTREQKEKISIIKSKGIGNKNIHNGYVRIYFPDHPKSDSRGWILEHDLIMECNIGRWLREDEVVHHKNKIKTDNRIENLQLLTRKEHAKLHRLENLKGDDDLSIKYGSQED